jgi:hypothetical protein
MSTDTTELSEAPAEPLAQPGLLTGVHLQCLYPEQIDSRWTELLLPAVRVGLGPNGESTDALQAAWFALKQRILTAYLIAGDTPDGPAVTGVVITGKHAGVMPFENSLHIWALYANADMRLADWQAALEGLRGVAAEARLRRISAQTNNPQVIELVKALGGSVGATLLELEV